MFLPVYISAGVSFINNPKKIPSHEISSTDTEIAIFCKYRWDYYMITIWLTCWQVFTLPEYLHRRHGRGRIRVYLSCVQLVLYILSKLVVISTHTLHTVGWLVAYCFMSSSKILHSYRDWLIDWLIILCFTPYRQYFGHITAAIHIETSLLPVMGFKIQAYDWHLRHLSIWTGRDLYRATPAVTRESNAYWGSILTRFLTYSETNRTFLESLSSLRTINFTDSMTY